MKVTKLLTLDSEVVEKAKEMCLNVSGEVNEFLKKKLGQSLYSDDLRCSECGREERKATPENLKGMTWLCPDEVWICSSCLKKKSVQSIFAIPR